MAFSLFGLSTLVTFLLLGAAAWFVGPKFLGKKVATYATIGLVAFGLITTGALSGLTSLTAGSPDVGGTAGAVSTGTPRQIDSLDISIQELYSNSFANVDSGTIKVYAAGSDPKDPLAVALFTSNVITDGRQTNTTSVANLRSNTPYRVIYDAGSSPVFYSRDFGQIQLADSAAFVGADTVEAGLNFNTLNIAGMTDMFSEETLASTDSILNGQASSNNSANNGTLQPEIGCKITGSGGACSADATEIYNQTTADGSVYLDVKYEATGSNEGLLKPVVCFKDTSGSELEDNEISSSTLQLRTGTDLGLPSNVAPFITNEECMAIKGNDVIDYGADAMNAQVLRSGTSSTYRWTLSITEANINAGADSFDMKFDDLGSFLGKDVGLRTGITADDLTIQLE